MIVPLNKRNYNSKKRFRICQASPTDSQISNYGNNKAPDSNGNHGCLAELSPGRCKKVQSDYESAESDVGRVEPNPDSRQSCLS